MEKSLMCNIHLNNQLAERVNVLYLFYRLRFFADARGGFFKGFLFTNHEKYKLLPELLELGLIEEGEKIKGYRKICNKYRCVNKYTRIVESDLESLDAFKGFLLGTAESYVLNRNNKIQEGKAKSYDGNSFENRNWVDAGDGVNNKFWLKTKKIKSQEVDAVIGRVYNNTLTEFTGLSTRTISRWRKHSKNQYSLKRYTPDKVVGCGRPQEMYYKSRSGKFYTVDLCIVSNQEVFSNRRVETKQVNLLSAKPRF